ncbi:MAG: MoxR family ATPase [Cystobacterineae bacterium]|nr:MoxR family ATPase [Cystobacterineae bacterium]
MNLDSLVSTPAQQSLETISRFRELVFNELRKLIVGQEHALELMLCALLSRGHALLEGVPGVAKTLMAKTLASSIDASFKRIQFTPDLMPADILGTSVFDLKTQAFSLVHGPIFTDILLADEINRAPAKTQSALLEAMQERTVSIEGKQIALGPLFSVFATQNPIESEGTYPLPEAQLDRFMFKIEIGYPTEEEEDAILASANVGAYSKETHITINAVVSPSEILQARTALIHVRVEPSILQYIRQLLTATRQSSSIRLGAGPRAGVHLLLASKTLAALRGFDFVTPDIVRALIHPVLQHRLLLSADAELGGETAKHALSQVVDKIDVPR